ncbi:hypothetical protein Y1Q_0007397 [Alligator mississippiensis]|uniref:Uncharacterized protein n=1 Tax=Alligator mississippiensis TaxID=8496 RepID=A0A151P7U1_ALLMI|nr:hypothetical protein Y1Q_0007397 [Alligator mississippiensis]
MMKQRRWRVRKKPMQPIHHLLLPRPKNMLDLLASAVAAMDLFSKWVLPLRHMAARNGSPVALQQSAAEIFTAGSDGPAKPCLRFLAASSLARVACADPCQDKLLESLHKDDAILKEV